MRSAIGATFALPDGRLRTSTGASSKADVWGSAFAVFVGALEPELERKACAALAREYANGRVAWHGAIRHVPTDADARADSAWDTAIVGLNRYQNGAYWSTATGWVAYAIASPRLDCCANSSTICAPVISARVCLSAHRGSACTRTETTAKIRST